MIHSTVVPTHQYRQFMSDITKQYLAFAHSIEHYASRHTTIANNASWQMVRLSNEGQFFVPNAKPVTVLASELPHIHLSGVGGGIVVTAYAYHRFYRTAEQQGDEQEANLFLTHYQRLMAYSMERNEHDAIAHCLSVLF